MDQRIALFLIFCIILLSASGCMQTYYNVATNQEETYFYSDDKEVKIGKALSETLEKKIKPVEDPLIQKRINDIGQKLVAVNDRKEIRYHFKVIKAKKKKQVNAFALPGGYIYIFKGLWDKIDDDDAKIAAVLAHEIAHVAARHSIKRIQSSLGVNMMSVLVVGSRNMDSYSKRKALRGINELVLSYSRQDEEQADVLAVKYMKKAGYEPKDILAVLDLLNKEQRDKPISAAHWRTHPYISERKKAVKQQINRGTIKFDDYINTAQPGY